MQVSLGGYNVDIVDNIVVIVIVIVSNAVGGFYIVYLIVAVWITGGLSPCYLSHGTTWLCIVSMPNEHKVCICRQ